MGIKITPYSEISAFVDTSIQKWLNSLKAKLRTIGLETVKFVRDRTAEESWMDQTGNLRSSIGYGIVQDGKLVRGKFEQVKDGVKGKAEGPSYLQQLASEIPTGMALIIVAGMDYAAYVEAIENKDVLAKAELMVREELKKL